MTKEQRQQAPPKGESRREIHAEADVPWCGVGCGRHGGGCADIASHYSRYFSSGSAIGLCDGGSCDDACRDGGWNCENESENDGENDGGSDGAHGFPSIGNAGRASQYLREGIFCPEISSCGRRLSGCLSDLLNDLRRQIRFHYAQKLGLALRGLHDTF